MTEKKTTILNVDDKESRRHATSRVLREAGFEVKEAAGGVEAIRLVRQTKPDLVLLDVNLPDINGFEVCQRIRADVATSMIPVIHLSAVYRDDQFKVLGLESGGDSYLIRPIEPSVLIAHVKALLRVREAEAEAVAMGQQWQSTFDAISEGVSLLDLEGRVLRCNKALARILGRFPSDIVGRRCWELVHGTSQPIEGCPLGRMMESHRRETLVMTVHERWYNVSVDPLLDDAGNLMGAVHIMTDITERRRAEKKVRFQAGLLDAVGQAVMATDLEGTITYWNRIAEELYGWSEEEVLGRNILEVTPTEATKEQAAEIMARLSAGESWSGEFGVQRRDGTTFPALVTDTPVHDEDGNLVGIIGISTDITEAKQAEEAMREQMRQAQRINELFLGREHRVLELKREVNSLLERLDEPPRYEAPGQVDELRSEFGEAEVRP